MKPIHSSEFNVGPLARPGHRPFLTTLRAMMAAGVAAAILAVNAPAEAGKDKHDWPDKSDRHQKHARGRIIVANRGTTNISVIDVRTDTVVATIALPPAANKSEPMYPVHVAARNQVFVGDRGNNRVVVFDGGTFAVKDIIPAGAGIWHMWADEINRQLWVANDIDRTVTVIHVRTHQVLASVPVPADLVALGGKPHDVFVHPRGHAAYVSIVGLPGANDVVLKFDTRTFAEIGRAAVGKDPHLSLSRQTGLLFVPCQNTSEVVVLDAGDLSELDSIPVPGAHGAGMKRNGKVFYTTNLPGGGAQALWTINTRDGSFLAPPVDTPFGVPHNLALTPSGRKLYVTHSGPTSTKVTVFTASEKDPTPVYSTTIDVGLNPFGITYAP
jgi:DNA-binding beta-propeller fold protein YncE